MGGHKDCPYACCLTPLNPKQLENFSSDHMKIYLVRENPCASGLNIFFLVLIIFVLFADGSMASEKRGIGQGVSMRVLWTVAEYHITPNAKWGEDQAKELLFKPLDLTPSSINFAGRSCHGVTFKHEIVDIAQYLNDKYQITSQLLSIKGKNAKVITTNCQLEGFSEYIRLADRRLIVRINGVIFIFNPRVFY